MRKLLYLLLILGGFTLCHSQNKASDFMKSLGSGLYSIPNKINGKLILPTYENYRSKNDSIFLEKILFQDKKENFFLLIANIMGGKTSLILVLRNISSPEIVYAEQIARIDTLEKSLLKDYTFFMFNSNHTDMCSETEGLIIYVFNNLKLYKSFEGFRKEEYYNTNDPLCKTGKSYTQSFALSLNNNEVMLIANKKSEGEKSETKKYYFKNYEFK